jgi:hypothetical protein
MALVHIGIWAIIAWQLIARVIRALSVPWSWTSDQYVVVFLALCMAVVLGSLAHVWQRDGVAGVKARMSLIRQTLSTPPSKRFFIGNLVLWVFVGLALLFAFNMMQR